MNRLGVVLVALAVLLVVSVTAVLWPTTPDEPGELAAGTVAEVESQGVVYLPDYHLYLVSTDEGPVAFNDDSRHLGDRVLYCALDDTFSAPHGERFDRLGRYLAGPAQGDLVRFPVSVDGGQVLVDFSVEPPPTTRSEGIRIPDGPTSCAGPEKPAGFYQTAS